MKLAMHDDAEVRVPDAGREGGRNCSTVRATGHGSPAARKDRAATSGSVSWPLLPVTHKVFIDGAAGTTGLEIADRLAGRDEFEILRLDEPQRKDVAARREALNEADIAILCLPDDAAREAVELIENGTVRALSTHPPRTAPARAGVMDFPSSSGASAWPMRGASAIPAATPPVSSR